MTRAAHWSAFKVPRYPVSIAGSDQETIGYDLSRAAIHRHLACRWPTLGFGARCKRKRRSPGGARSRPDRAILLRSRLLRTPLLGAPAPLLAARLLGAPLRGGPAALRAPSRLLPPPWALARLLAGRSAHAPLEGVAGAFNPRYNTRAPPRPAWWPRHD